MAIRIYLLEHIRCCLVSYCESTGKMPTFLFSFFLGKASVKNEKYSILAVVDSFLLSSTRKDTKSCASLALFTVCAFFDTTFLLTWSVPCPLLGSASRLTDCTLTLLLFVGVVEGVYRCVLSFWKRRSVSLHTLSLPKGRRVVVTHFRLIRRSSTSMILSRPLTT